MLFAARDEEAAMALLALVGVAALAGLIVFILYMLSLTKALQACSPRNRAMAPGLVWLNLVPILNLVWPFVTVIQVGNSLRREYRERGMDHGGGYGTVTGVMLYATKLLAGVVGFGGLLFAMAVKEKKLAELAVLGCGLMGLVQFVLFVVYWVQVAALSRGLTTARSSYATAGRGYSY